MIKKEIEEKELKQVLHFRFSFEPRFSEVDKSLFLAPPLRTTSCNVHYSGSIWQWKTDLEQVYSHTGMKLKTSYSSTNVNRDVRTWHQSVYYPASSPLHLFQFWWSSSKPVQNIPFRNSYFTRIVFLWNNLLSDIKSSSSVATLKSELYIYIILTSWTVLLM
jgi:hypothetical protein